MDLRISVYFHSIEPVRLRIKWYIFCMFITACFHYNTDSWVDVSKKSPRRYNFRPTRYIFLLWSIQSLQGLIGTLISCPIQKFIDLIWFDLIWFDLIWFDLNPFDLIPFDLHPFDFEPCSCFRWNWTAAIPTNSWEYQNLINVNTSLFSRRQRHVTPTVSYMTNSSLILVYHIATVVCMHAVMI